MKNPFSSELSEPTRRRVELATAVAQERLLSTHVDHALRLIQLLGEQVPFESTLGIYTRLLRLSDDEARVVTTRSLAILGEKASESPEEVDRVIDTLEPDGRESSRSFLRGMRQRLRGRVKDDLRRWVELAAARAEVALLNAHVDNAINFVDLLQNELEPGQSVELYMDALELRDSVAEVTYYLALSRIADEELPDVDRMSGEVRRPAATDAPVDFPAGDSADGGGDGRGRATAGAGARDDA